MTSSSDVIRLAEDNSPRHQPVKVSLTSNEVKVTLTEVKVINSSSVRLFWQLIGARAAVQWLRVQYWSDSSSANSRSSAVVPSSVTQFILNGLQANSNYAVCVQPVYKTGVVGKCSNIRHAYVAIPPHGYFSLLVTYFISLLTLGDTETECPAVFMRFWFSSVSFIAAFVYVYFASVSMFDCSLHCN